MQQQGSWNPMVEHACSADILKDYGLEWVILGHSERRSLMHETSEVSALSKGVSHADDDSLKVPFVPRHCWKVVMPNAPYLA